MIPDTKIHILLGYTAQRFKQTVRELVFTYLYTAPWRYNSHLINCTYLKVLSLISVYICAPL